MKKDLPTYTIDDILNIPEENFKNNDISHVKFDDGNIIKNVKNKKIYLNYQLFKVGRKYQVPINKFYFDVQDGIPITSKDLSKALKALYEDIINIHKDIFIRENVAWDFYFIQVKFYKEFFSDLHYMFSIDILDLVDIKQKTEQFKVEFKPNLKIVEDELHKKEKELVEYLKNTDNKLRYIVQYLNPTQLYNIFCHIGFKTDIDDRLIPYFIESNLIDGMENEMDFIVEDLAAKKSSFLNKNAVSTSQYFNRKQQLLVSPIRKLYPGDCGSDVYIPYHITEEIFDYIKDKWFVHPETNELFLIDESWIGKELYGRSPLTCKYTDGVCEKCFGLLSYYIPISYSLGQICTINITEPVTQRILSSKHFQKTNMIIWNYPAPITAEYFLFKNNYIYIKKPIKILIPINFIKSLINIKYMNIDSVFEKAIGKINYLYIVNEKGEIELVPMKYEGISPNFTSEAIFYIKENFDQIVQLTKENFIIDLKNFDPNIPLFETDILNSSMIEFVKKVRRFLEKSIGTYTSIPKAIKDFVDIVFDKVKVPIVFMEVMLKAYLIDNEWDLNIPVVTDINDVKFGTTKLLDSFRYLSILLTFENLKSVTSLAKYFTYPFKPHRFDKFIEGIQS